MAKVFISYDTETKVCQATVDGEAVPNLCGAEFYNYNRTYMGGYYDKEKGDVFGLRLNTAEQYEDGMSKMTTLIASKTPQGEEAIRLGHKASPQFKDFIEKKADAAVFQDIAKYL